MTEESTGKVYLTGGGCGDAGLLTLRALEVLRGCDTVVYDSLVAEELLTWCRPDCEKLYVGKRYGSHAMKQDEINNILIERAKEGRTVARLKGGDPYVFGRGGEEFLAVTQAGISCEEIPGISSAIAVPAAAGIPVTHRGLAASVTVVTGTAAGEEGQERLKLDFSVLARLEGTLVILMGMHHLGEIAEGLLAAGKAPDTPCAVIMEGTTLRQKCVRGELARIAGEAAGQGLTSPAVIVVGAVAGLKLLAKSQEMPKKERASGCHRAEAAKREADGWEQYGRPGGVTVGVTGTPHFVRKLSAALVEKGADVWDMGFLEARPSKSPLPDFTDCGWLVFTSPNGVRIFLDKMKRECKDLRSLFGKRIAVVGSGTAAVLEEAGLYADYMPESYDVGHLARGLAQRILDEQKEGRRFRIPAAFLRAANGSASLSCEFTQKGISFLEYPIYDLTVCDKKRAAAVVKEPDYIVFGSAMGVRAYFEGLLQAGAANEKSRFVCIGPLCGQELQKYTKKPFLTARESGVQAIVECIYSDFG